MVSNTNLTYKGGTVILFFKNDNANQSDMSKYNKDSYSITGKKVCLVLVISKFDNKQYDRKNT